MWPIKLMSIWDTFPQEASVDWHATLPSCAGASGVFGNLFGIQTDGQGEDGCLPEGLVEAADLLVGDVLVVPEASDPLLAPMPRGSMRGRKKGSATQTIRAASIVKHARASAAAATLIPSFEVP